MNPQRAGDRTGGEGATLVETDKFGMTTNGLGRLANKGEAGYIVKVTKSFHSLALINPTPTNKVHTDPIRFFLNNIIKTLNI